MLRSLPLLAATLAAAGCVDTGDRLESYRAAVRELAVPAPDGPAEAGPRLPDLRFRRVEVERVEIGVFDFLSLQGCPVAHLIGERNSALGRLMEAEARLGYELELVGALEACLDGLSDDRRARLAAALARKRAEHGLHLWNALWAGDALPGYLRGSPGLLAPRSGDGVGAARALAAAVARARAEPAAAAAVLEALARLREAPPLGPRLRELDAVRQTLGAVSGWLAPHREGRCDRPARRLTDVFLRHYIRGIQPRIAGLDRAAGLELEALARLYEAVRPGVPVSPEMARYAADVLGAGAAPGLWRRYRQALEQHVAAWAPLLERCGVLDAPVARVRTPWRGSRAVARALPPARTRPLVGRREAV